MTKTCTLCRNNSTHFYQSKKPFIADYFKCESCCLIFMDAKSLLDFDEEKKRYETHNNDINDSGYVDFLNKIIHPLKEHINIDMKGLDYGSGPSPVLSMLLGNDGFKVDAYDPHFSTIKLKESYDFITSTEVVEHFYHPIESFEDINSHLIQGGFLAIMTSIFYDEIDFDRWYYRHDNTHVSFYAPKSLDYIENYFNYQRVYEGNNTIIWKKL